MLMILFLVLLTNLFVKNLQVWIQREFEISLMGELTYFLGLKIKQVEEWNFITQMKYCLELFKKFEMQNLQSILTHMASNMLIYKDENKVEMDINKYRGIIWSLIYLIVSGPNIIFSVCMCTRYQASLGESHFKIIKRIWGILTKAHSTVYSFLKVAQVA